MYISFIGEDSKTLAKLVEQQGEIITLLKTVVQQCNPAMFHQPTVPEPPPVQQPVPVPPVKQPVPVPPFQQPVPVPPVQQLVPLPVVQQAVPVPPVQQPVPVPPVQQSVPVPPVQQPVPIPPVQQPVPVHPVQQPTVQSQQVIIPPAQAQTPTLLDLLDTTDEELDDFFSSNWLSSDAEIMPSTVNPQVSSKFKPLPSLTMEPSSSTHIYGGAGQSSSSSFQSPVQTLAKSPVPNAESLLPPPPFSTPPKLVPVDQVMKEYPGRELTTLRRLAAALARDAIFGRDELRRGSLRGGSNNNYTTLDKEKLNYIKMIIRTRATDTSALAFEAIWDQCRTTISKLCQQIRDSGKSQKKKKSK